MPLHRYNFIISNITTRSTASLAVYDAGHTEDRRPITIVGRLGGETIATRYNNIK